MVCLAGFGCNFVIIGIVSVMGILLVGLSDAFDDPISKLSLVGGLHHGLIFLVAPIANGLLVYFSHRTVIIIASLSGFMGIFIGVFYLNIEMLIVTFGLIGGFASGLSFFASNFIVGSYFDKKRALAVSTATCGGGVGVCVMNIFTEKLLEHYGLRGTLLLISGVVLNMVVFGALCRPLEYNMVSHGKKQNSEITYKTQQQRDVGNPSPSASSGNDGGTINGTYTHEISLRIDDTAKLENVSKEDEKQTETAVNSTFHCFKKECLALFDISVLKNCNCLLLVISYFLWSFNTVVLIYLPTYALSIDLDRNEVAALMSIRGILTTIGQLLIGFIIHILHINSDRVFVFSLFAIGSSTFAISHCNSFVTQAINTALWGTVQGSCTSLRLILITDIAGIENISKGYTMISLFIGLGYTICPPLFGLVYDIIGSFKTIFYVVGMCSYLASVLLVIIVYRRKQYK